MKWRIFYGYWRDFLEMTYFFKLLLLTRFCWNGLIHKMTFLKITHLNLFIFHLFFEIFSKGALLLFYEVVSRRYLFEVTP